MSVLAGHGPLKENKDTDMLTKAVVEHVKKNTTLNTISEREKRELRARVEAMTPEELAIVVDCIPVNLCMARIHRELDRAASIEKSIKNMIDIMEK